MKQLFTLLLIVLLACSNNISTSELQPTRVTLEVRNDGYTPFRIYVFLYNTKRILGSVYPDETACFYLESVNDSYYIVASSIDGDYTSPSFTPSIAKAWKLNLGNSPQTDMLTLQPTEGQCRK